MHLTIRGAASQEVGRALSIFLVAATLLFTVIAALAVGIAASYAVVTGILAAFGNHSRRTAKPARLAQSHAIGD